MNLLWLCCTRLQLQVFHFFDTTTTGDQRRSGFVKTFTTASNLIELVTTADSNSKLLLYSPPYIYRMLIVAAVVLLKTIESKYSGFTDLDRGKRNINAVILLLRRHSLDDCDIYKRSSKILAQLWISQRYGVSISTDRTSLRDLGANILHDTLWTFRHKYDRDKFIRT